MLNVPAPLAGPGVAPAHRAPPLAGVVLGVAISLLLWAVILGAFLILR